MPDFNFVAESFSEVEAAQAIGLRPLTLRNYRLNGTGPRFTKVSAKNIRYKPADLTDWLESRTRTPKPVRADLANAQRVSKR